MCHLHTLHLSEWLLLLTTSITLCIMASTVWDSVGV